MKKSFLLFIILAMFKVTFGQLTGTYTIPGAPYATIAAAITALNTSGVGAGGVTFNITAGYTETFASPTAGQINTNTGTAANQIIFQKAGAGANPVITSGTGTTTNLDAIICFNGVKYITFDGINVLDNPANTTTTTQMEFGFAVLKASVTQGSQNITIKNCTITLNKTNTATYGIYSANHTPTSTSALVITAVTGQNANNKFYGNTFANSYGGIYMNGYSSASPYTYYDQANDIGSVTGNTFSNFGGAATTSYVIYVAYQNDLIVANSSINGGTGSTAALYGIYGGTATNANASIYGNTITLTSAGTTAYLYGIYNPGFGTGGTTNTLAIYNNTVQNCTYPTATTAYFYGIYSSATARDVNFYGNVVNNNVIGGSAYTYPAYVYATAGTCNVYNNSVTNNQRTGNAASGYFYCLYIGGTAAFSIHDNTVSGNSATALTGYYIYMYSIYCSNSSAISQTVYNNTVHDQTVVSGYTSGYSIYGIYAYCPSAAAATNSVHDNTVYNLSFTCTSTGYCYIYGIASYYANNVYNNTIHDITQSTTTSYGYSYALYCYYGLNCYSNTIYNISETATTGYGYGYGIYYYTTNTGVGDISYNKIYGISMAGTASGGYYYCIYVSNAPGGINVYNNYISDIKAPTSASTTGPVGIYIGTTTNAGVYYNTVYLNATSSSTGAFNSAALYVSTTPTVDLRNNILINTSTAPGSTTYIAATYRRSSASAPPGAMPTYSATSNNNDFFAGTPSTNNVICYDGTNKWQTLADFKTAVVPRDALSVSEMPPFVNVATTPYNLHVQTTVPTQLESGGSVVNTPVAIIDDFDNDARYPNVGYPNNAGFSAVAPDIGADEFGGLYLDMSPPTFTITPLPNTSSTTAQTLICTIFDASGVPASGAGLPRLYWRINSGSWNNVAGVPGAGNQYSFTFGAGVVLNDMVSYYLVAQDMYSTPNIGASPSAGAGGFSTNPPACSTPPTTPYSYAIVDVPLNGDYTVGASGAFTSLTNAVTALNMRGLSGTVRFLLLDASYSASETFPLMVAVNNANKTTATNTVTIKPSTGVTATITGAVASGKIFDIRDNNFIIDGSNATGGTTRDLTINNTSPTTPQVIFIGSTGTTPVTNVTIKNCILINGVNSSSALVLTGTDGLGGYFNNITIQNNSIQLAYIGIYFYTATAPGNGSGLLITGNDLNSATSQIRLAAIYVQGADGAVVSNNTIGNMANTLDASNMTGIWFATGTINSTISGNTITMLSGTSTGPRGIAISSGVTNSNVVIDGNNINNLSTSSSVAPYGIYIFSTTTGVVVKNNKVYTMLNSNTGGYGVRGIYVLTGLAASNISIFNNVVYDLMATSDASLTYYIIGIGTEAAAGGVSIYHNSVNLSGTYAGYTSATVSAALYIGASATAMNVRDNILVNSYDNTNGASDKSYAIYCAAANTGFTDINFNDYWVSGTPGVLGYLGADQTTLALWQTASGKDASSTNLDPLFVSATNLTPTNIALNNMGVYIPTVPTDFNGIYRTNPPDMGAIEFGTNPLVNTTAASSITTTSATLTGTINASSFTVNSFFDWGLTTAYGNSLAGAPPTVTGSTNVTITAPIAGLLPYTTYHYRARGVVTPSGLIAYGPDMTFTTLAVPATVVTTAATAITTTTATLNGTVNANNSTTTVTFEYGLTAAYGSVVNGIPPTASGTVVTIETAPITGLAPSTLYHFRITGVNSGGTANGSDMTFTTSAIPPAVETNPASNIGVSTAQLNGTVNANNASTTVSFDWGLTTAYGNNVAGVPGTVTGNTPTPVLANIGSLTTGLTYHFRCNGTNAGGTTNGLDQSFVAGCQMPGPAGSIAGPPSTCTNSTNVGYSVGAILNATTYTWTVPAGANIVSGQGTQSILVNFGASSGSVTVFGGNGCGTGTPSSLTVTVNALPTPTISGNNTVCQGSTGNGYTTQAGMTNYNWIVSAGGTLVSGAGTNAITVTWNSAGAQTVSVNYNNAAGCSAAVPTVFNVTVNASPTLTVTGQTSMCVNSGFYDYTTQTGMSNYTWTVSSGGTITFGQGTSTAQVSWTGAGAQTVSVTASNAAGCFPVTPGSLNVTVGPLPDPAGTITGVSAVCGGTTGVVYSCVPIPNTMIYVWSFPPGVTIVGGFNTNSVTVNFGANASSGNVIVFGNNPCGDGAPSPPFPITVTALVGNAGNVTGPISVCQGDDGIAYSVDPIPNATSYTWTVPSGALIASGANTNAITVDFSATASSGPVGCYASNSCGSGLGSYVSVTVSPVPVAPVITSAGQVLTSSAPAGNQWYFSTNAGGPFNPIPGATGQTYTITQSGYYYSIVTLNGCSSAESNHELVVMIGIAPLSAPQVEIYPVPNDGRFNISITAPSPDSYSITVLNNLGVKLYEVKDVNVTSTFGQVVDLRPAAAGVYTVIIQNSQNRVVKKIIINK